MRLNTLLGSMALLGGAVFSQSVVAFDGADPIDDYMGPAGAQDVKGRSTLSCQVSPTRPELDYDFTFRTGYRVDVPMEELRNAGNQLSILFRVTPGQTGSNPIYMFQRVQVSSRKALTGVGSIQGDFSVGLGDYHVDWMLTDGESRVCFVRWDFQTKVDPRDTEMRLRVPSPLVGPHLPLHGTKSGPANPSSKSLNLDIVVNFGSENPMASTIHPEETFTLVGMLRAIATDPHVGKISVVGVHIPTQQLFGLQEEVENVDFVTIRDQLQSIRPGLISAKQLGRAAGPAHFLADLLRERFQKPNRDALIIVSPKPTCEMEMPKEVLRSLGESDRPIIYFSYVSLKYDNPWRDLIGKIVKYKHGLEYRVSEPKEFLRAWLEASSRLLKTKTEGSDPDSELVVTGL